MIASFTTNAVRRSQRVEFWRRCLSMTIGGGRLSASWRNALFALSIGAILAYGAAFAWYMLANFDLVNLLRDVNFDDSFYYFQIARNLAEGEFSTFDGGITRTNGYHPLWMLLIVPFHWAFDREAALFAIKAFEIMLVAGGIALVVTATRLTRLPWILTLAALPALFQNRNLYSGLEAAAALFMLGLLFLTLCLYARNSARWKWALATVVFALPWVRLEYAAISLAATTALCLIGWSWQDRPPHAPLGVRGRSISVIKGMVPLLAAGAGILVYGVYNQLAFGGIAPVSGASRIAWSQVEWERDSLTKNLHGFLEIDAFDNELWVALEVCAYLVLVWWFARRSHSREDWLLLAFLTSAFGLAVGHLGKFAQSVLTVDPLWGNYGWYFVPAYLMMELIVPVRLYVAIHLIRRFIGPRAPRTANILSLVGIVVGVVIQPEKGDITIPFGYVDQAVASTVREWEMTSYAGTKVMNRLIPKDSVVGSWNAGVTGYFSSVPVVNLDGLVNSYDYFHARRNGNGAAFYERFGITHFADVYSYDEWSIHPILFQGASFSEGNGAELRFNIWRRETADRSSDGANHSAAFWKRMAPHWDYEWESISVIVDGAVAQAFARDCESAKTRDQRDQPLFFSLAKEGDAGVWFPWRDFEKTDLGFCAAAFELDNRHWSRANPIKVRMLSTDAISEDGHLYLPDQVVVNFEDGFDGWFLEGEAVTNRGRHERYKGQQPISGNLGRSFLTSYHPENGDRVTGRALSPAFTAESGQYLLFLIAGGKGDGVGLRLLADGDEAVVWHGENTERFERVIHPLAEVAGQRLQLELFDEETGGWGHIMLDHVMLARRHSEE